MNYKILKLKLLEIANLIIKKDKYHIFPLVVLFFYGFLVIQKNYSYVFGAGDISTFYSFARNILNGEVIYRDFIHFRTPGSYYLMAFFLKYFGNNLSSIIKEIAFESVIFYPLSYYFFSYTVSRNRVISFFVALLSIVIQGPYQIRSALILISLGFFVLSLDAKKSQKSKKIFSFFTGLFLGVNLFFGQDMFILTMVLISMGLLFLYSVKNFPFTDLKYKATLIISGFVVSIIPQFIYFFIFSNFKNFAYYTTYYALILQPKGRNLPYPVFSLSNVSFYLPYLIICIYFLTILNRKGKCSFKFSEFLLISLVSTRMITAAGRADYDHLLYSVTELFLMTFLLARNFCNSVIIYSKLRMLYSLIFIISFVSFIVLAINGYSFFFLLMPILFLLFLFFSNKFYEKENSLIDKKVAYLNLRFLIALIAAFIGIYPFFNAKAFLGQLNAIFSSQRKMGDLTISATEISKKEFNEINSVKNFIDKNSAKTIFSYPIRAYYYVFGRHVTPYMTFEEQTTQEEQANAIKYLSESNPRVVIFDHMQAVDLSGSLNLISDYITSNYKIDEMVLSDNILHMMTQKDIKNTELHFLYRLKTAEFKTKSQPTVNNYINYLNHGEMVGILKQQKKNSHIDFKLFIPEKAKFKSEVISVVDNSKVDEAILRVTAIVSNYSEEFIFKNGIPLEIDLGNFNNTWVYISFISKKEDTYWKDPLIQSPELYANYIKESITRKLN